MHTLIVSAFAAAALNTGKAQTPGQLSVVSTPAVLPAISELAPSYLKKKHVSLKLDSGGSSGNTGTAIPARLDRGEVFDVIILFDGSLNDLIHRGKVLPDSKVDLVSSDVGLATKAGSPKPDIHNAAALKKALLAAKSITYTPGVSGVYVRDVMFPKLGIAEQMKAKTLVVQSAGDAVAEGKAEIGIQQVSELMTVKGLDVQAMPHDAAETSTFSAGIPVNAPHPEEARAFIEWLASPEAYQAIRKNNLRPFHAK